MWGDSCVRNPELNYLYFTGCECDAEIQPKSCEIVLFISYL